MPDINGFYKPELTISLDGNQISYNSLTLDSSATGLLLKIDFSENPLIDKDAVITGLLSWNGGAGEYLFSSRVDAVSPSKGNTFRLLGRESYFDKMNRPLSPVSWRNSNLKEILQDLFEITDLERFDYSVCSDISISRFSVPSGDTGFQVLQALLMMIRISAGEIYCYRPSTTGSLLFGPKDQLRHKMSVAISFESGINIISRERERIQAFALPVVFNQIIEIDGEDHICLRSIIKAKPGKYRVDMEVEKI